jgi:hypothetical protein
VTLPKLTNNIAPFPTPPDVPEVVDALAGMVRRDEVARCIVLYERLDGSTGWLTSAFAQGSDQLGFVESVKLQMFYTFSLEGGE